jgi:hypothetical protein
MIKRRRIGIIKNEIKMMTEARTGKMKTGHTWLQRKRTGMMSARRTDMMTERKAYMMTGRWRGMVKETRKGMMREKDRNDGRRTEED